MRYLLIDDDGIFNFIHDKVIRQADPEAEISVCDSCMEALSQLRMANTQRSLPDFIFLDINMPEMSGFEFLDELTRLFIPVDAAFKVYMVTSSLNERDYNKAMQYEFVKGFYDKPLTGQVIMNITQNDDFANKDNQ